ncbi:hypothetical protein GCM10023231_00040 [Olivibacter ginsenosidimutans]|uniref:Outer membrane beta-barrel protein n=2 Tax=Olivibacter ginsenosidimutans TaxID=1176537 RepID=A0ABP9AB93_9SPHI
MGIAAMCHAQLGAKNKLSIGPEVALPMGDAADAYQLGYGLSLQGEYQLVQQFNLTASIGYLTFAYKKEIKDLLKAVGEKTSSSGSIPLKAGGKYYFSDKLYGGAEIGASFSTAKGGGTAFAYAPAIGINLPLANRYGLDVSIRFEGWSKEAATYRFFGLRAAFTFGI